jgi:hypothetical protein
VAPQADGEDTEKTLPVRQGISPAAPIVSSGDCGSGVSLVFPKELREQAIRAGKKGKKKPTMKKGRERYGQRWGSAIRGF